MTQAKFDPIVVFSVLVEHDIRFVAVAAVLLAGCGAAGYDAVPAGEAFSGERCFEGEWREEEDGALQRFSFDLRVSAAGDRVTGAFDWRAVEISSLPSLVGRRAQELLEGRAYEGRLELRGTRVDDPLAGRIDVEETFHGRVETQYRPFMSVDRYRIAVSHETVTGRSRTDEGDWSGTLEGHRVDCASGPTVVDR